MSTLRRSVTWASATVLTVVCAGGASAQSATTGAISGQVTTANGGSADGAQVQVVSRQTGARTGALVRENGRYLVQGLEPGPGYTVTVRRIGFAPVTQNNVVVTLGQATRVDLRIEPQATVLATQTVTATATSTSEQIISPTRTGVGRTIGDTLLRRLPTLNRNFTDFVRLTPQVQSSPTGGGVSAGGAPARLNNIQIDGANATDVFGLNSTGGQPGQQGGARQINIEAVKEYQVLLSPYDVRQGLFSGALVNAITKNGTNEFHGTAVATTRNEKFARDVPFVRNQKDQRDQYDFSLGGPIVRDKAFFFLAPSFQHRQAPASGPFQGQVLNAAIPFVPGDSDVTRFTQILRDRYSIDPGTAGQVTNNNPLAGLFSRLDFNLPGIASRLVVRNNYQRGDNDVLTRSTLLVNPPIALASQQYQFRTRINQTVAQLNTTTQNGLNNEFIVSYQTERDRRIPTVNLPQITVQLRANNSPTAAQYASLVAGAEASSQANQLDQNITEFTDNLSRTFGAHTLTVGSQNQIYKIRNLFAQNLFGTYVFTNFDSLAAGNPRTYAVAKDQGAGLAAQFKAGSFSGYAQDLWSVNPRLNVTYGVRVDVGHFFDQPFYNPVIDTLFRQRTDNLPNNQAQVSPRVGFNWDVTGNQKNQLRGGVGSFTGRPSYVFFSNAFGNTGAGVTQLNCGNSGNPGPAPTFSADPNNQSSVCRAVGTAAPAGITGYTNGGFLGAIATVDRNFKNPQTARATLGYDRALTPTLTLTLEGLYSKAIYSPFYVNDNLKVRRDAGGNLLRDRNGRVVYGSIAANGATSFAPPAGSPSNVAFDTATLVTNRVTLNNGGGVIRLTNQNKDYSYTLTAQLDKRFTTGARITGSYTYGRSYDVQSLTSDVAGSNFRFGRTLSDRPFTEQYLGRSIFDQPHRVLLTGSYTVPKTRTDLSLIYDGHSGSAYDYVYAQGSTTNSGDLNADGQQGNDLVYVPRDVRNPNEIRWTSRIRGSAADTARDVTAQQSAFDNLIESTRCLRNARGTILGRNACRNPWQNNLQASLRQSLPSLRGNNLSLQLDVFNFLNLLNRNWGEVAFAGPNSQVNLLTHQGQTAAGNPALTQSQGIFTYGSSTNPYPPKYTSQNFGSYYQIQLGVRYGF